jgi:TolB-like protein
MNAVCAALSRRIKVSTVRPAAQLAACSLLAWVNLSGCIGAAARQAASPTTQPLESVRPGATERPKTLASLLDEVRAELATAKRKNRGALVFVLRTSDGQIAPVEAELHDGPVGRSGYWPLHAQIGEPAVAYERSGRIANLRASAPGYHEFRRPLLIRPQEVTVWDDCVLERVTETSQASIGGTVWVEDDADPTGITVRTSGEAGATAITDAAGRFLLTGLGSGLHHVGARKPGYAEARAELYVGRAEAATCDLRLYRKRAALVRWAYQSDGSTRFSGAGLRRGVAVLMKDHLDCVNFRDGFQQNISDSDFGIRQEEDTLILRFFHHGERGPGLLELLGVPYDDVTQVPQARFQLQTRGIPLREGVVYVLKCCDGEHFAKLEALKLVDNAADAYGLGLRIRYSRCATVDLLPETQVPASIAVVDFDAGDDVPQGTTRAVSDLCRGVIQDTGRFILVDRQSMVHILGEEDFAAAVKCDDTRCVVNYGRKLRAQKMLHGRISKVGDTLVLTMKVVDVGSAAVDALETARVQSGEDELLDLVESKACTLIHAALTASP